MKSFILVCFLSLLATEVSAACSNGRCSKPLRTRIVRLFGR